MKKLLLLFLLMAVIKIEAQQNRGIEKSDIKGRNPQTGKEIKIVELNKPDSQRTADLKKLADELVNAFAIDNVIWSSVNYDSEMAISGGGATGKATFKELKVSDTDMDGDGRADALRGIEKSDIRRGVKIKNPSQDKSTKPIAKRENQRVSGDLKNLFPPGNKKGTGSRFKNLSEITYFAWEIIGADIPYAEYVIEITKIDNDGQSQQTFIGTTDRNPKTDKENKITDKKVAKFKAGKSLADTVKKTGNQNQGGNGEYQWTVTETTIGISSNPSFFTISDSEPCEIDIKTLQKDKYCVGDIINVNWAGNTPTGQVNISLFDNTNGAVYAVLATGIPNTGTFIYTIPNGFPCAPPRNWTFIVEDAEKLCLDRSDPFIIECCGQQTDCDCGKWTGNSVSIKGYNKKIPKDPKLKINVPINFEKKVECGDKIELKPTMNYTFTAPNYVCNPENCEVEFKWEIIYSDGVILAGNGQTFNYAFSNYGTYKIIFTPICGGKSCQPCVIYVNIDKVIQHEPGPIEIPHELPTNNGDVYNPKTGKTWMNKNLGASQVATSSTDAAAYGDLYQWGRLTDGHEKRTSSTTTTVSTTDVPGHNKFIVIQSGEDWRSSHNNNLWQGVNGINNPCPSGYRIPTDAEFDAERLSWVSNDAAGAFASPLKWTLAGARATSGTFAYINNRGFYLSSNIEQIQLKTPKGLIFTTTNAYIYPYIAKNMGSSVRCIKN